MTSPLQRRLRQVERRADASPGHTLRALFRLFTRDEWPENQQRAFELLQWAGQAIVGRAVLGESRPQTVADVARHEGAGWDQLFADLSGRPGVPQERVPQLIEQMAALRDSARRHGIGPLMDEQRRKLRHENWVGSGDPMWMCGEPDCAS